MTSMYILSMIFLVGPILFVVTGLGVVIYFNIFKAQYWISQDNKNFYATEIIKEENGCLYFIDSWTDNETKVCGQYAIRDWKQKK